MVMGKKRLWAAAALLLALALCGGIAMRLFGHREYVVGRSIKNEEITDFYWTYSSSTNPPAYQRYRFFVEDGRRLFFHEKREGDHWPLTEQDATVTGTAALTDEQWDAFLTCVAGGTVVSREESVASGDAGPWTYLYWQRDRGEYQQFSFASYGAEQDFVALCETLRG